MVHDPRLGRVEVPGVDLCARSYRVSRPVRATPAQRITRESQGRISPIGSRVPGGGRQFGRHRNRVCAVQAERLLLVGEPKGGQGEFAIGCIAEMELIEIERIGLWRQRFINAR
jgi:hypothetical protein